LKTCGGIFDVPGRREQLAHLEAQTAQPDFWNDTRNAQETVARIRALRGLLEPFEELERGVEDAEVLAELAASESDAEQRRSAWDEVVAGLARLEQKYRQLELRSLLSGELDANNAYVSLHAGAGGTESCDWAAMLLRMYRRYAESHGFGVTIMDILPGEEAGIRNVTFLVSGPYAYGYLKGERGVHRLVRISPFDANRRRHTSFASVDVVAEVDEEIQVEINDKDLRIDTFRASGAGGQHVNVTDSAVRITHLPTGIVVQCQAERSQHSNRAKAMKMLKAKLYEYYLDQRRREMERFYGEKGEIAWGRQIRSYVLQPYTMVKDHRTGVQVGDVQRVLDGDLDVFIEAYLKQQVRNGRSGENRSG